MNARLRIPLLLALFAALAPVPDAPAATGRLLADVPFRLHDDRILVDVTLDGHGPFTMIFDTGGGNVITPECARRLGLASAASESTSGAGEKQVPAGVATIASMKLGALEMRRQVFHIVDLGEIRRGFRFPALDGVVGRELLERAHASVDFDGLRLRLREPSRDPGSVPADAVRFALEDGMPVVEGRIDGVPARLLVDTGDRSNLTVFRAFAARTGLDSLFAARPEIPTGIGIGGPIPGRVATVPSVEFGTVRERDVVARLPSTRSGGFATSPLAGSIGLGLMRNYDLEIDYRQRWLALRPHRAARVPSAFVPLEP